MNDELNDNPSDDLNMDLHAALHRLRPADSAPRPPVPPVFLHAVKRRRHRRAVIRGLTLGAGFSTGAMALFALSLIWSNPPSPVLPGVGRLALSDSAALVLTRANADLPPEAMWLPEHAAGPIDPPLRMDSRFDPAQIEQWMTQ